MNYLTKVIFAGLALFVASCSSREPQSAQASADAATQTEELSAPPVPPPPSAPPAPQPTLADKASGSAALAPQAPAGARLLVYKAHVDIRVDDLGKAAAQVDSVVRRSGSWASSATQTREEDNWRQEMTIRVRPQQFTALLNGLARLGTVENKAIEAEDVTGQHADVSARLRTKRALEQRYVGLLSQAKKISEVLEIEQKLGEVREDIEATDSRLKTLNDEVAYSTIFLKLYQPLALPTPEAPVLSFGSRMAEAFYGGWHLVTNLVIGAVYLWPAFVLLPAGLWLFRWWRRRPASAPR
ncbi:DUF4349 domain-containing protein [Hymenobacter oligotrophus]|uniref:DUF4349 domain-containing protein n=1 Tax=Hymenobacter oligotrophus TaxID=2319843 RepID=A0A3B7QYF8_9BACT|nr:DUF4349 domain-containing protein [Hymenobacter oligotrophus]AYA36635.1 DUF4349 domain-containing protein [Hymenobacter oligotrophus]